MLKALKQTLLDLAGVFAILIAASVFAVIALYATAHLNDFAKELSEIPQNNIATQDF